MSIWVQSTGFEKKTLAIIKAELELAFQTAFGSDIDLSPEGAIGQIIGILSQREADLWDGAEEIYTSRNPNEATGSSLDNIAAETGVRRLDSTATRVDDVQLFGTEGTVVAAGKQAKQANNDLTYSLEFAVTITAAAARKVRLAPEAPTVGKSYTVTIDATPYNYVAIGGDTLGDVIDNLVTLISAGFAGTEVNINDEYLELEYITTNFSVSWSATISLEFLASGGAFNADEDGANPLPANSLTEIITTVSGWTEVNNPSAGITGRDEETDDQLRLRRGLIILTGNATDEAIRSSLLNEVDDVSSATVVSNRTMITDSEGRPAKSFEAVVAGGTDLDVATAIWNTMPSGIQSYGSTSQVITDSQGFSQTIYFSRPTNWYIHVKVQRNYYDEESYPADGDAAIKTAIVAWATTNLGPGNDVIRLRLSIPIYTIPGIKDIIIYIDGTANPGDSPVYALNNITIPLSKIANFDTSRIVVENIP